MTFANPDSINNCFRLLYDLCIFPGPQQRSAFTLSVGNSSDVNDHTQCASHNGAVAAGVTVNESCTATGQYLSFRVKSEAENPLTTLCEVVVIGHKYICTYSVFHFISFIVRQIQKYVYCVNVNKLPVKLNVSRLAA